MKFIKSLFLKIKAKATLKTYQKPLAVTLFYLLLANFVVLLIGAGFGLLIDKNYYDNAFFEGSFASAFITNVKWMISPNSLTVLNVSDNRAMLALAIVIVVIGMILFSGAIIATVTTSLRTFIDRKSHAKGKIILHNHFVIINWSSKVPEMIYNLAVKGFKNSIVILSNKSKDFIESEVHSLINTYADGRKLKVKLIIKQGDALLHGTLEDISIERASQICIMVDEEMSDVDDDNVVNADLHNLKIALRLGALNLNKDCQIVVETDSDESRGQIESLARKFKTLRNLNITAVSFNKKIGQIIAQSLIMPQMSNLYSILFSFEGAEFYSVNSEQSIEEYMETHPEAIPVHKDGSLFVLAEDETDAPKTRDKKYVHDRKFTRSNEVMSTASTIFIIGSNNKTKYILNNLERFKKHGNVKFHFKHYEKLQIDELINDIKETEGDRKVLILSDDTVAVESYDANVFLALIELSRAFPNKERLSYVTELLDSRNLSSIMDFDIKNAIISNRMMSLLITQQVLNKHSKNFFDKILTISNSKNENDFDIVIEPAPLSIVIEEDMVFESKADLLRTFYNTFDGKRILIGLVQKEEIVLLTQNQDKKEKIKISKNDSFIYFKYMGEEK